VKTLKQVAIVALQTHVLITLAGILLVMDVEAGVIIATGHIKWKDIAQCIGRPQ